MTFGNAKPLQNTLAPLFTPFNPEFKALSQNWCSVQP